MIGPTRIEARACARTHRDGTRALHPTDLGVEPGERLVLLGPSGCGKTTMLRILSGLDRPDPGGRVLFGADDVTDLPIERRDVGMVFQSYALFPNMSVAENVAYGLRLKGVSRAEREARAAHYLRLCRIEALGARRIDQLSGGQRQRVALARALAAEPRALFLDEPLTALDASLRETLREEIAALLAELSVTSVYVTHDQAEAMAIADRIVVMSAGRIEQIGTPREVYERPENLFVATFFGETNRLPDGDGRIRLVRPEHMRLVPPGEGLAARVVSTTYLGATTRVTLDSEAGPIRVLDHEVRRLAPGDAIGVLVDESRVMTFPTQPMPEPRPS
ncbi:ABC transporter ATP-binding protein [Salinarimonas chemoclinalis]|uniref:ABC transporter ATP-binding protein n=1 Tax=Salinarimonas chemoclinalis TaxID=3241599 RepID=UPI00355848A9